MLYFKIAGPAYGCDDIKAYRCVNLEKFDIGICGSHCVFYLLVGYCIFRLHDIIAISCFDLYNDQFIILSCHNIPFASFGVGSHNHGLPDKLPQQFLRLFLIRCARPYFLSSQ